MSYNRRRLGLSYSIYFIRAVTCLSVVAIGAAVAPKLVAAAAGSAVPLYAIAIVLAVIGLFRERQSRFDAMADIQYDIANVDAGARSLDTLGVDPMTPSVMKRFEWTVVEVVKGVVLFNDLAVWHCEHRTAARQGAIFVPLLAVAAAGALYVLGVRFEPVIWAQLVVASLLPLITLVTSRNELPKSILGTPEDVARCIFCVIMRQGEGRMALKNALISMVDKGVDGASVLLDRKIASWMANLDVSAPPVAGCGCVHQ